MQDWMTVLNKTATRRIVVVFVGITLIYGTILLVLIDQPWYTDAYYYYNAAERFAIGDGFTDPYLFNYLNAPDRLPAASFRYWQPLYSILSGLFMSIFGVSYDISRLPSLISLMGLVGITGVLSLRFKQDNRQIIAALLIVMLGGTYGQFWFVTDNHILFGFLGSTTLLAIGLGQESQRRIWFILAGFSGGLAYLSRSDGLLLPVVGICVAFLPYPAAPVAYQRRFQNALLILGTTLLTIAPWLIRNQHELGEFLPSGGLGVAFLKGYEDMFEYPVVWSFSEFWEWGISNILQSRLDALWSNLLTLMFTANAGLFAPFVIVDMVRRRRDVLLAVIILYLAGLYLAMSLVFAYPGMRGALFHSSTALLPFFVVMGVNGLDVAIDKLGAWRRWQNIQAMRFFVTCIWVIGVGVLSIARITQTTYGPSMNYAEIMPHLPSDAIVMVNDPGEWYYYEKIVGVPLPSNSLEVMPVLAGKYCVTHVILGDALVPLYVPLFLEENEPVPDFLDPVIHLNADTKTFHDDIKIFEFRPDFVDYASYCELK